MLYETVRGLLDGRDYSIIESFTLPGRSPSYRPIPPYLFGSEIGFYLRRVTGSQEGLWSHQSLALERLKDGANLVVSTGTASGKSLIFRSAAFHRILLEPSARVLVFYPLKALASDQLRGWETMAEGLGLTRDIVGRIDGSVPSGERDGILQRSRIAIMTPDVCHAWLMSRLAVPEIKAFLRDLCLIVLDEAHTLEGVFGSNFGFLIRRLMGARNLMVGDSLGEKDIQFIALTATISNPEIHLKSLTGLDFGLVSEKDDGSSQSERYCAHVASPPGEELSLARLLHIGMLRHSSAGTFITFLDSRKGVESLAVATMSDLRELLADDAVMPYRAGFDSRDREEMERRLQSGELRGVVSTSALELGIDLPHLAVGLNIGVPATRKAYQQRLGRIGRSGDGAFIVIAPPNAFTRYGTSFQEYHELSVEPSYLYLDNRFMQFAHGRCLADELDSLGAGATLPPRLRWPNGFRDVFNSARPGGDRPPEFDAIAQLGGDTPHFRYPLRNVGEINFKIARGENADPFGEVSEAQALRECYPGATYLHLAKAYEVVSWNTNAFQPFIMVRPMQGYRQTRPRIRTWINAGITPADLIEGHIRMGETGFLAECQMQITERVEGFTDVQTGEFRSYQELRQRNPNMRPRMRNFRTSGVILCIDTDWFRQSGTKQFVADRLLEVFCREYSVLPQDVGAAATNISVRSLGGRGPHGSCVVVFDQTYGSLRLTERLFLEFGHLLDRLTLAAHSEEGADREYFESTVISLRESYEAFTRSHLLPPVEPPGVAPTGYLQVFTPGSRVCYREMGSIAAEVEIIRPTVMDGRLMYQVKFPPRHPGMSPARRWVNAELVEPPADGSEWEYAWWNSETEEYEEPPENTETRG